MISRMPTEDNFSYKALENLTTIRLLKIIQLDSGIPLQCELVHIDLDAKEVPIYSALSYFWGPSTDRASIICNGKRLSITSTLEEALRMTHVHNSTEYIWADQVCINQDDAAEKPQQIQIMTTIFQVAWVVLAWLGPECPTTGLAIQQIEKVATTWRIEEDPDCEYDNYFDPAALPPAEEWSSTADLRASYEDDKIAWLAFTRFFDRPWFERIWVVQEMYNISATGATRQIEAYAVCGTHILGWGTILAAAQWASDAITADSALPVHSDQKVDGITHVSDLRKGGPFSRFAHGSSVNGVMRSIGRYKRGTINVLRQFRSRKATDPRDKIWALVGLTEFCDSAETPGVKNTTLIAIPKMPIDYSLSVLETYRNFVRYLIQWNIETIGKSHLNASGCENPLDILLEASVSPDAPDWPSWVPDWRLTSVHSLPACYASGKDRSAVPPEIYHHFDPCCLKVGGVFLGRVTWAHDKEHASHILTEADPRKLSRTIERRIGPEYKHGHGRNFSNSLKQSNGGDQLKREHDGQRESTAAAFLWTLSLGWLPRPFEKAGLSLDVYEREETLYTFLDSVRILDAGGSLLDLDEEQRRLRESMQHVLTADNIADFNGRFRGCLCGRRLFTTDTGYIGVGALQMQPGDAVAILFGMSTACVLRPYQTEQGEQVYRFLGDAWVRGAMHGEVMGALLKAKQPGMPLADQIVLR